MASDRATSPFPGMDPYLERYWPSIHLKLIAFADEALNVLLPPDLVARPEEMLGIGERGDAKPRLSAVPDLRISTVDNSGDTATIAVTTSARTITYGPLHLKRRIDSPLKRRRIKIFESDGGRLVTVIEFVSPANKRVPGRRDFLGKRRRLLSGGVNVVEIDLTRTGPWRRLFDGMSLEGEVDTAYRVATFVSQADDGFDPWLYPLSIRTPLPELTIPLRHEEQPIPLALQPLIDAVYRGGRYGQTIDYNKPPEPPLESDDANWAAELLKPLVTSKS